jgi:hypothetical protein
MYGNRRGEGGVLNVACGNGDNGTLLPRVPMRRRARMSKRKRARGKELTAPVRPLCLVAARRVACALRGWRPPCVARVAGLARART